MFLTRFTQQLLTDGSANVEAPAVVFEPTDDATTITVLRKFYQKDIIEMPLTAPAFNETAALWAVQYFFAAVHFTVLREASEETITTRMINFPEPITPEVCYSVDLIFRHLPSLQHLAAGLAPGDILVKTINDQMKLWPLSAPQLQQTDLENEAVLLSDPCLKIVYFDRIIAAQNTSRIRNATLKQDLIAVAGNHLDTLWPDATFTFKNLTE